MISVLDKAVVVSGLVLRRIHDTSCQSRSSEEVRGGGFDDRSIQVCLSMAGLKNSSDAVHAPAANTAAEQVRKPGSRVAQDCIRI